METFRRPVIVLGLVASLAQAASFTIDVAASTGPLRFPMLEGVGSGHAALGQRADYRQIMASVSRDIGFKSLRAHGVLDDDMSTYLNGGANMLNVFSFYDYLLSIGVAPLVELSFMPSALASNASQTNFHYVGGASPPQSYDAWAAFITEFTQLLVDRYGLETVRTWNFEVWNEPTGMWTGGQAGYMTLYNYTARAVKAVDAKLRVGGPASAGREWLPDFIAFVRAHDVPVDFVSTHCYPSDPDLPESRTVFEDAVAEVGAIAAGAGLPLLLTEYSYGWRIPVVDEPYAAAFAAHVAVAFQNVSDPGLANVPLISWWAASDIFEEPGLQSAPYLVPDESNGASPAGKMGLATNAGVPKPAYRALQMISGFQGLTGLAVTSADRTAWYGAAPGVAPGASVGTVDVLAAAATSPADGTTSVRVLVANWNAIGRNWRLPYAAQPVSLSFACQRAPREAQRCDGHPDSD